MAGTLALTSSTCGLDPSWLIGAKSFTGSYFTLVVAGTNFRVANVPVLVGSHAIDVQPMPNQTQLPGAGVTVYGFDAYVSYGYTGGLDLTTIVTGINPGG